jgi:hypothetical protein
LTTGKLVALLASAAVAVAAACCGCSLLLLLASDDEFVGLMMMASVDLFLSAGWESVPVPLPPPSSTVLFDFGRFGLCPIVGCIQ